MTTYLPAVAGYPALAAALDDRGLGIGDIVHVTEYVTSPDISLARARQIAFAGHQVPVSRVPVEAIVGRDDPYALGVSAHPGGGTLAGSAGGGDALRVADGIVYLPSVHTTQGEFREQYRWCLDRIAALLDLAGLTPAALTRTIDHTATATRAEYPRCGRPRREVLGPIHPGAAGILVDLPVEKGARVAIDALAATGPLSVVNPGWERYETLTYNPAVRAGDKLFMSGFGALDPVSQLALHDGDLVAQAEYIYASVETVLAAGGASGSGVSSLIEYVTPSAAAEYHRTRALREKHFPNAAVTSVVCSALLRPEFLLETIPAVVPS
ncbi:RidA family protein [Actinoplanes sp. CA-142083]|uniref:RidA family protein n=1 Tax=Actinoplanes sp. CA-142083 TaxID=3239903 RepID=UPI003D945F3C